MSRGVPTRLTPMVASSAALLFGALPAPETTATKLSTRKDSRPVSVRVASFSADCTTLVGTPNSRPAANDDGTVVTSCTGGGMGGAHCAYMPKESTCSAGIMASPKPNGTPDVIDGIGRSASNSAALAIDSPTADAGQSVTVPDAHQAQDTSKSKKHGHGDPRHKTKRCTSHRVDESPLSANRHKQRSWASRPGPRRRVLSSRNGYGAGVASPVMSWGGSTRKTSLMARSWPSLRISPATLAGM